MALGHGGRFFAQLAFFLRRHITIREALELLEGELSAPGWAEALRRIGGRIDRGETLGSALAELPPPFPRAVLPFVEAMESEGLLVEELEVLAAWPDEGTSDPTALLARIFAHVSILLRGRQTISEALRRATAPGDPEPLKSALRAVSKASILDQSLAEAMGESPGVFSPAVRRMVLQMERNGDAATTFRDLGLALARGWFPADTRRP